MQRSAAVVRAVLATLAMLLALAHTAPLDINGQAIVDQVCCL